MIQFRSLVCKEPLPRQCAYGFAGLLLVVLIPGAVYAMGSWGRTYNIRSESTLNSDGSIHRAVVQPLMFTSETAQAPGAWGQFPDVTSTDTSLVAKGRFDSVEEIPAYYEFDGLTPKERAKTTMKFIPSTLERHYTRVDHVFAVEHQWEEFLTSGPRLTDVVTAFHERVEWALAVQNDVLGVLLRPEYDASPYLEWFRSDLVPLAEEWLLFRFELAARAQNGWQESEVLRRIWEQETHDIGIRLQQQIPVEAWATVNKGDKTWDSIVIELLWSGLLTDPPSMSPLLHDLFETTPTRFIRRADGQPLDVAMVESFWKEDGDTAVEALMSTKYAGKKEFNRQASIFILRIFGPYAFALFDSFNFQFSISMPGYIVETNGEFGQDDKVTWHFGEKQVDPLGFRMYARSLEPNLEIQHALTGQRPLTTPRALREFSGFVADDTRIQQELQESLEAGRLSGEASFKLAERYRAKKSPDMWFWYCYAAGEGHERTLYYLGSWYASKTNSTRIGLETSAAIAPDDRAAFVWYALAHANGYTYSAESRKSISENLTPQEREEAEHMLKTWTSDKCPWPGS